MTANLLPKPIPVTWNKAVKGKDGTYIERINCQLIATDGSWATVKVRTHLGIRTERFSALLSDLRMRSPLKK